MSRWLNSGKENNPLKLIKLFPLTLLFTLSACAKLSQERVALTPQGDCPAQSIQNLLNTQDQLGNNSDEHTLSCAITYLRNHPDPALQRSSLGSRLSLLLAERETNPERREKLAAEGVGFAETALAKGGEGDATVHYYLATNLGLAVRDHVTLAMDNLGRLESELKKSMNLNPGVDAGGPLRVLGTLYLKAPAWPNGIGDPDKALELLARSVKEYPSHPLNHLFYAQALWDVDGDSMGEQAKQEFGLGIKALNEGQWGYRKSPWQREFDDFQKEVGAEQAQAANK